MINPLIVIPSPRDIPDFKESMNTITKYDKLWVKYHYPEITAYKRIRHEFLTNDEYTHLVIVPDDLIITQDKLDILINDYSHIQAAEDTIITGYSNVDTTRFKDCANICLNRVSNFRFQRVYSWITLQDMQEFLQNVTKPEIQESYLMTVGFAGFACFVIPRKIVEHRRFRNDSNSGEDIDGCCVDSCFCNDILDENYRILCDIRCRFYHMKISDAEYMNFYANVKDPYIYYQYKK